MNSNTDALKMLFGINYDVLKKNLEGVSHDESLLQPPGGANCLNWVLGHVVATRDAALKLLHQQPIWDKEDAALYRRGSAPIRDGSKARPFETIVADLDRSQGRLMEGLAKVTEPELGAPLADQSAADTVGGTLFVLHLHESYHAGQTGLLRRMAGHEGAIK